MSQEPKLTESEVAQIAQLARLRLKPEQISALSNDLSGILGYMQSLKSLDLTGVEPTAHGSVVPTPLREDVVVPSLSVDDALAGAPRRDENGFLVPKVVG